MRAVTPQEAWRLVKAAMAHLDVDTDADSRAGNAAIRAALFGEVNPCEGKRCGGEHGGGE